MGNKCAERYSAKPADQRPKYKDAMSTASLDVLHAYRYIYRTLLEAVQYSSPARYVARDQVRAAFREPTAKHDAEVCKRTLWFLEAAARERGLEHRILKNLLRVKQERLAATNSWKKVLHLSKAKRTPMMDEKDTAMKHYEMTIKMLNYSMGIALR